MSDDRFRDPPEPGRYTPMPAGKRPTADEIDAWLAEYRRKFKVGERPKPPEPIGPVTLDPGGPDAEDGSEE